MLKSKAKVPPVTQKRPKSPVVKRSIVIAGHKTSISLEDPFWKWLKVIAGRYDLTLSKLVAKIDANRKLGNLSSAIRIYVLNYVGGLVSAQEAIR